MNNEIGRKITSLTLMTIMLAGGMSFAIPGMEPAYAANANLFVSAENSQFDNYMSGPQVIEVVVLDSDLSDLDQSTGIPTVTVNDNELIMVQGSDGNWYGYFADEAQADLAEATTDIDLDGISDVPGYGLDFGINCSIGEATTALGVSITQSKAIYLPTDSCTPTIGSTNGTEGVAMNVVRESKAPNTNDNVDVGQIGIDENLWPFIQLFALTDGGNVEIQYERAGGVQSSTLTFDSAKDFASIDMDKSIYSRNSQVHATITDLWLNIDPTDEDSWTFGTLDGSLSTNYQVFDENGEDAGAFISGGTIDISDALSGLMVETNGVLIIDANAQNAANNVLTLQENDNSYLSCTDDQDITSCDALGDGGNGLDIASQPVTITESELNSGIFETFDTSNESIIIITSDASRGTSATIDYNDKTVSILTGFSTATIDIQLVDDEWSSGEVIPVTLIDNDANKNSRAEEDFDLYDPSVTLIPTLVTGDPFTFAENDDNDGVTLTGVFLTDITGLELSPDPSDDSSDVDFGDLDLVTLGSGDATITVDKFSKRANVVVDTDSTFQGLLIDLDADTDDLQDTFGDTDSELFGFNLLNIDFRSMGVSEVDIWIINNTDSVEVTDVLSSTDAVFAIPIANDVDAQSFTDLTTDTDGLLTNLYTEQESSTDLWMLIVFDDGADTVFAADTYPVVADFFSFGFINDGLESGERIANQIIRIEAEETGDNTGIFEGFLEYTLVNQINILDPDTYTGLSTIAHDPDFIVIEDLTDEDSPRVNYFDLGSDGVSTQVSAQEEAPSHSGVVSFDSNSYKTADTVTITLEDVDLNVDSDIVDIFTIVTNAGDQNIDTVGTGNATSSGFSITLANGNELGKLLQVSFDDQKWQTPTDSECASALTALGIIDTGFGATGFTLVETGTESGIFMGTFQIPSAYCPADESETDSVTGLDISVDYVDFRDASGEVNEVGDSAGVRANTGSVSLDRTVYPVPFGVVGDFEDSDDTTPSDRAIFPIHASGMDTAGTDWADEGLQTGEFITGGDLIIHVRVNDPDFDVSASGEDTISTNSTDGVGPVKVSIIRGSSTVILGYAGGDAVLDGIIDTDGDDLESVRAFGPMDEIAPDAGIFESDITIRYTDGPASTSCPDTTVAWEALDGSSGVAVENRFDTAADSNDGDYCILQGDILQIEYTDPADASGDVNTVTDSATFDLRNGVLQTDKSVYIIGSDMILTLIEPDLDLDNDQAETYDLDLIEWDSDAAELTMGDASSEAAAFDPEPTNFRETGDSTGIFQIVIEIPEELDGDKLERGEEIDLEYTDWGPSGANYVGDEDEDVTVTIFTSNFGATVELDQKVYTWTDKVYITIVAPDHNFDGDSVDEIGNTSDDPIKVSTRGFNIDEYKLVETGTDTGIFTGEVILTGFSHDSDGDTTTGDSLGNDVTFTSSSGSGPTDGLLPTDDDDGLTVSFEFSEGETIVGSALIRWNIGETQWLEASYPASGTGVVRVIDPDMNLDPEAVDNFSVDVWSDSDAGGIDLTVTETNEATGIFEGTVFFTVTDDSSGHRLRVAEGDTVTAEYEDNTLPDPYTTADELDITSTSLIGTVVPPLERAPAANLRTVDAFGNSLDTVSVDQQVQISADLSNGQDREQTFAYLVQIQDGDGVTVSLAWITGSLASGQSFSPALSWIPTTSGSYTATAFVWESVDNPTALSPPVSTTVNVR